MRVLYATDGLDPALAAGSLLEKIADRPSVEVTVLSIATLEILIPEKGWFIGDSVETRRAQALHIAEAAARALRRSGVAAKSRIAVGSPGEQIVRAAEAGSDDLIVVGARRKRGLERLVIGSNAEDVLRGAPCSVLVVHEAAKDESLRILVATDGSSEAELAATQFGALADPGRCEVEVVSVAQPAAHPPVVPMSPAGATQGVLAAAAEVDQEGREIARDAAERVAAALSAQGFSVRSRVLAGEATWELRHLAQEGNYDLVVAGSRGRGMVRRLVLGSVSRALAVHAHAALVARAPRAAR